MRAIVMAMMVMTGAAQAEAPRVLTDIAPVHALVAQVMGDLGTPQLLLDPRADPHHFQMRPSQARQIDEAEVMIWMGAAMTPWLPRVIDTVGSDVTSLELLELPDLPTLIIGEAEDAHTAETHTDVHDTHGHGATDPHAWLDPENAKAFLAAIAQTLGTADPDNTVAYHANAGAAQRRITALANEITAQLTPAHSIMLVPYHDAYRYFLARFDLQVAGALASSDAAPPSAGHLADIRDLLANTSRFCVFTEPGGNLNLIQSVLPPDLSKDHPIAMLDPLGSGLTPGPELYEALMRQMADAIATCETP